MTSKNKNNFNLLHLLQVREYRKSAKYHLTLNIELEEIIIGLMLGDLFAEKIRLSSNTRLQFKQSEALARYKVYINIAQAPCILYLKIIVLLLLK
jgi:hypothetical protein